VPAHALAWWVILAVLAVILAAAGLRVARALAELKRIAARVDGLADSPLLAAADRAEASLARIDADLAAVPALVERAAAAVAVIRKGPVPPELTAAARRIAAEIATFRRFARR
jgi:hypothetical protein